MLSFIFLSSLSLISLIISLSSFIHSNLFIFRFQVSSSQSLTQSLTLFKVTIPQLSNFLIQISIISYSSTINVYVNQGSKLYSLSLFSLIRTMISCFCLGSKNKKKKPLFDQIIYEGQISEKERQLLTMIFMNLADRSADKKLTQNTFMLFFCLTGLWGDKLFRYFNRENKQGISLDQFLNAKTARNSFDQKVHILFNFIKEPNHRGIRYRQFLKMLNHFSKDELKEIVVNDGVFVHESIIPEKQFLEKMEDSVVLIKKKPTPHLNLEKQTSFQRAYQDIISQYQDPGTTLHFKTEHLTYRIDYINMTSLTKEFSTYVFKKYGIKENVGFMNEVQFNQWIKGNPKLFQKFFNAFRQKLWAVPDSIPSFLQYIQKEGQVDLVQGKSRQSYMMLVENIIFFSVSKERKDSIFKIVCLDGLAISLIKQNHMEVKDIPAGSSTFQLKFRQSSQTKQWLQALSNFEKNYIQTKYEVLEPIGAGKFSVVFKAVDRKTKKQYALKVIDLRKLDQKGIKSIENETKIMKTLSCHSVIKHYETIYSKHNIYISSEYIFGEDLFQYVKKKKRLDQYEAAFILGQIMQAVLHLHTLQIIHRDLKPENIMIQYKRQVQSEMCEPPSPCRLIKPRAETIKIIDLGFSNYSSSYDQNFKPSLEGTLNYMAPQVLLGQKPSFQNDTFAIGSILYFMLRGKYAFESSEANGISIRTVQGDFSLHDEIWDSVSDEAKELIEMLLQIDPKSRISLKTALNHPWFLNFTSKQKKRKDSTDHE